MEIFQLTDVRESYSAENWDYQFLYIFNREERYKNYQQHCDRWALFPDECNFITSL